MSLITDPLLYWGAAVLVVLAATGLEAQRMRLDPWTMYLAGLVGLGGAMLGGDWYVALLATEYVASSGARGVFGALVGAGGLAWLVIRMRGGNFLRYADASAPGIALGYAVYRVGCFFNGCCFGAPTELPWGVAFGPGTEAFSAQVAAGWIEPYAAQTLPVHPTQLYLGALGLAAFFILLGRQGSYPGVRLALALALYGAGRFSIEFLRADTPPMVGPLNVNHVASIVMLALALLLWRAGPRPLLPIRAV